MWPWLLSPNCYLQKLGCAWWPNLGDIEPWQKKCRWEKYRNSSSWYNCFNAIRRSCSWCSRIARREKTNDKGGSFILFLWGWIYKRINFTWLCWTKCAYETSHSTSDHSIALANIMQGLGLEYPLPLRLHRLGERSDCLNGLQAPHDSGIKLHLKAPQYFSLSLLTSLLLAYYITSSWLAGSIIFPILDTVLTIILFLCRYFGPRCHGILSPYYSPGQIFWLCVGTWVIR